jgi:nucleoside phosphorylase
MAEEPLSHHIRPHTSIQKRRVVEPLENDESLTNALVPVSSNFEARTAQIVSVGRHGAVISSGTNSHPLSGYTESPSLEPAPIEAYTVGWICALQEEYQAACRMLDEELDGPEAIGANDNNTYAFGRIGGHYVVIGCLPMGRVGNNNAASVARDMVRSFPSLKFALMVGIGGGAPTKKRDIRLGDVVVSVPDGKQSGVVQYDFGKMLSNGYFERTGQLNAPPNVLLGAVQEIKRLHDDPRKPDRMTEHMRRMDDMPGYQRPGQDRLYRADYEHRDQHRDQDSDEDEDEENCPNCESNGLAQRQDRKSFREVNVHYGTIASGNAVMKDAKTRDRYAKDRELNVLCFEMEAAGLMNNLPCLVIRGICDYSDSHKNDDWHKYAALAAAAYAMELLIVLKPQNVVVMPSWDAKIDRCTLLPDALSFRPSDLKSNVDFCSGK